MFGTGFWLQFLGIVFVVIAIGCLVGLLVELTYEHIRWRFFSAFLLAGTLCALTTYALIYTADRM